MSRYPSYPAYRDSGVSWLGLCPDYWTLQRVKSFLERVQRPVRAEDEVVTAFRNGIVTLRSNRRTEGFTYSEKEIGYQGVRVSDLVVHAMDGFAGAIGVSDSDGKCTPVYSVLRPAVEDQVDVRYYAYLLRFLALSGFVTSLARGIRERSTEFRYAEIKELWLPVFPIDEQRAIADFLDRETARIDALMAKKQRLIELLQEKRTALISHAVTKGLDAGVAMKGSGVAWIGEVPAHWDVVRMRYLVKITTGGKDTQDAEVDGSYPFFVRSDTIERSSTYSFDGEAVLTSGDGAGVGKIFHHYVGKLEYHQRVYLFSNFRQVIGRYLYYFIAANLFKVVLALSAKSTVDSIRLPMLQNFPISFGPRAEQEAIVEYLDLETKRLDDIAHQLERNLQLLQEYRTSVISAAVTGKIDVRPRNAEIEAN